MFTIKLRDGARERILEAESFTVILGNQGSSNGPTRNWAEITLHHAVGDCRYDVGDSPQRDSNTGPQVYQQAYIENAAGKTVAVYNYAVPTKIAA